MRDCFLDPTCRETTLDVVVSSLVFPWQFIERWLIATSAVAIFCYVEFLMLVIFHAGTVLSAPAISFSVDAMRFHKGRISSSMGGRHTARSEVVAYFEFADSPDCWTAI